MKKEGIQTRNRKITSRSRKRKCLLTPEDNNTVTLSNKDCIAFENLTIQQCNSVASYSDQENTGSLYNPQAVATTNSFNYNGFSNMPQAGYGFHACQQSVVGSISWNRLELKSGLKTLLFIKKIIFLSSANCFSSPTFH